MMKLFLFLCLSATFNLSAQELFVFPAGFHKGAGISVYQNGGHCKGASNWSEFEKKFVYCNAKTFASSAIKNYETVGESAQFWKRAIDDIALIAELGCNSFRFSLEWADIETQEGFFDEDVLQFYDRYIDALLTHHITPMITLYHFVHPKWFADKGGFEKEENIEYFIRFCAHMFERFAQRVHFWGTINEPTVVAGCGYVLGIHPPGHCLRFNTAAIVLKNLLQAHVNVYKALKQLPHGDQAHVGIIHQMLQAESFNPSQVYHTSLGYLRYLTGLPMSKFLNTVFAHEVTKQFLKTGEFNYYIPGLAHVTHYNPDAPHSYDFIGLNFYSKVVFGPHPTCYKDQLMTDMDYPMNPESIYDAIVDISQLGKPIYVTENGVADAKDHIRGDFIRNYVGAVHQAVNDGYDVRGYYYWTLMDNFEWNDGYCMKFGLYHVDFTTQKRTLRAGGGVYKDSVQVANRAINR
jgi:beta-glucosidase